MPRRWLRRARSWSCEAFGTWVAKARVQCSRQGPHAWGVLRCEPTAGCAGSGRARKPPVAGAPVLPLLLAALLLALRAVLRPRPRAARRRRPAALWRPLLRPRCRLGRLAAGALGRGGFGPGLQVKVLRTGERVRAQSSTKAHRERKQLRTPTALVATSHATLDATQRHSKRVPSQAQRAQHAPRCGSWMCRRRHHRHRHCRCRRAPQPPVPSPLPRCYHPRRPPPPPPPRRHRRHRCLRTRAPASAAPAGSAAAACPAPRPPLTRPLTRRPRCSRRRPRCRCRLLRR